MDKDQEETDKTRHEEEWVGQGQKDSEKVKCRTRGLRTVKRLSVGQGGKGQ